MAPEMFIGLGLSSLLIMMFGKSPAPETTKPNKKPVVTIVLPDGDGNASIFQVPQEATFKEG